jgi:hypothetical protein
MATSNVQIANLALQKLGVSRKLESLTQDHPNARTLNLAFEPIRAAELRRYDWSFAIKRESIAADANGPTWGDWNRYGKPNDFIRLLRDDETGQRVDWKIEGLFILSRTTSPLEIRYLAKITDPNFYDALFIEALAAKLAWQCCEEITGSVSKRDRCQSDYDFAIAEARRIGAIEKEAQDSPEDDWLNARL